MTEATLAKVRKLLAKAEDPATTPQEAELYTAKAAELIAVYGVDRALLAQADPPSDVVGDRVVLLDRPYALDKAQLLSTVACSPRCRAVHRTRTVGGEKQVSLHLFGYKSDLMRAELLFTSLLLQVTSALAATRVPPGESAAAFRRSWLAGYTAAVGRRLREAETDAERAAQDHVAAPGAAGGGRSLALVLSDRSEEVNRAMERAYPYLRTAAPRSLSGSGGLAGYAAGQRADLGGARLARAARGRLGR